MFDVERIGSFGAVLVHARIDWLGGCSPALLLEVAAWLATACGLGMVLSRVRELSLRRRGTTSDGGRGPSSLLLAPHAIRRIAAMALAGLAIASRAQATSDVKPAATVLLPYFEVRLPAAPGAPVGGNTAWLTLTNITSRPVLTRVVLWSDLAVPLYGFNLALPEFGVQTIDIQQVLIGNVPQSGSDDFPACEKLLPPPRLAPARIAELQALLAGKPSPLGGKCAGFDHGDGLARGYVTVDVVRTCKASYPSDPGYFGAAGTGVASNENRIVGSALMIDGTRSVSTALPVAHLQAFSIELTPPGTPTFYQRYIGADGTDGREPLSASFAIPFYDGAAGPLAPTANALIVWRDTESPAASKLTCGTTPAWYPLPVLKLVAFDKAGTPEELEPDRSPLPLATGRARIGTPQLPALTKEGWLALGLKSASTSQAFASVVYRSAKKSQTIAPAPHFPRDDKK